tara:strand:+ start:464 stop:1177 length:714 start_codon:yes stop_codon:yes gene_type:complete
MNRKKFIKTTALAVGGAFISSNAFGLPKFYSEKTAFELPQLPYSYDALNPFIDKVTMEIHHSKHHQGYVNKLNIALEVITAKITSLEYILRNISDYSTALRNNAGGHYNHSLFWTILTPKKNSNPSEKLLAEIIRQFGSLENLKKLITKAASNRFGSGWAWLSVDADENLFVSSTPNQDNPLMNIVERQGRPILGIDVWEHAYYLKYNNKRGDYLSAIWNIIDWVEVSNRYENYLLK